MNTAAKTITAVLVALAAAYTIVTLVLIATAHGETVHRELACTVASQCAHLQQTHPDIEVIYYPKVKAA